MNKSTKVGDWGFEEKSSTHVVIDVGIYTEHAAEDVLHVQLELFGERNVHSGREDLLIVQLVLYPTHQAIHIFRGRDLDWLLHLHSVRPVIFISKFMHG